MHHLSVELLPRYIDTGSWDRRGAFEFFRDFDNPFFNITARLDVGPLVVFCKAEGAPFSLATLYAALRVANEYEPFRYRLDGGRVLAHDAVHASTTALVGEERLAFLYFDYAPSFADFRQNADAARRAAEEAPDRIDARAGQTNVLHFSTLPWVSFTSVSHARNWGGGDSVPKVTFGRYERAGDRTVIPVSVEVHHALMDGLHVGQFFERLQRLFAEPRAVLGLPQRPGSAPNAPADVGGVLDFLRRAERLKDTVRSGHTSGGRRESVADHTWRLCLMALVLHDRFPDVDLARLLGICVVHDLGEAISGDVPAPEQAEAGAKADQERRDLLDLLSPLPPHLRQELAALWDEYEAASTPEARLAKALDKLETLLQHTQGANPPDFDYRFNLDYGRRYTTGDPTIEAIRQALDAETERRAGGA